jgi:hypothetical protein
VDNMEPNLETEKPKPEEPEVIEVGPIPDDYYSLVSELSLREVPYEGIRLHRRQRLVLDNKVRKMITIGLIIWLVGITLLASTLIFLHYDLTRVIIICIILAIPIPIFYLILIQSSEVEEVDPNQKKGQDSGKKPKENPYENIIYMTIRSLIQLEGYYIINKGQAKSSFRVSIFAIIIGFLTIILGTGYFYLRPSPNLQVTTLSAISGVLLQFIGGAYFFIYRKSLEQMNAYFDQLVNMQNTMVAIQLTRELTDPKKKLELTTTLVTTLLQRHKNTSKNADKTKIPGSNE